MKLKAIAIACVLALGGTAFGAGPCKQISNACVAAGYYKGGAKQGRGLYRNCIQPLLGGAAVANVSVDAGTVQACIAKKAARHAPPPAPPQGAMPPPKS